MIYLSSITTSTIIEKRRILCRKKIQNLLKPAWNLHFQNCAKTIGFIQKFLFSKEFIDKHKTTPEAFTRQRKLPFHLINCFGVNYKPITWQGLQVLAIDGTLVKLPEFRDIIDHFGMWHVRQGRPCPMARISQLFDPLNKITVNALISPKSVGERKQAASLFSALPFNALLLLDRGYPAFWLFKLILSERAHFCARASRKWKSIRQFINSGKKEKIIQLKATYSSIGHCREIGLDIKLLTLRLIRVALDSGEIEVLITSLTDKQTYSLDVFAELY